MKKLIRLFLLTILLVSCSDIKDNTKSTKADYVLFSGKITNFSTSKVRIKGDDFKQSIKMENSEFADTLRIPKDGFYTFGDGHETTSMYLKKGSKVHVTLDTKAFDETVKYTGSDESNFLAKKYMFIEKSNLDGKPLTQVPSNEIIGKAEALKKQISDLLNTYKVSETFKKEAALDNNYLIPATIAKFLAYQGYFFDRKVANGETLEKTLDGINYEDEVAFKTSDNYKTLVDMDFMRKASKSDDKGISLIKAKKSAVIRNYFLKQIARDINPSNKNIDQDYNAIMAIATDQDFKDQLTRKYNKFKDLASGKPSPTFENFENYKGGTTSLADLKGKYVYIDVWATWCGPCKHEIPFLQKIEEKYHNKNIAFISLSIDDKKAHEAWKTMIQEKNMGGIQLFAPKDWKTKFVQDYGIEGIPTFILIDPKGNIVSASAPRPSSPKLPILLDKLL